LELLIQSTFSRFDFLGLTHRARLFCVVHGEMTLLDGFMKKSQKTPKLDLTVVIDRKR